MNCIVSIFLWAVCLHMAFFIRCSSIGNCHQTALSLSHSHRCLLLDCFTTHVVVFHCFFFLNLLSQVPWFSSIQRHKCRFWERKWTTSRRSSRASLFLATPTSKERADAARASLCDQCLAPMCTHTDTDRQTHTSPSPSLEMPFSSLSYFLAVKYDCTYLALSLCCIMLVRYPWLPLPSFLCLKIIIFWTYVFLTRSQFSEKKLVK